MKHEIEIEGLHSEYKTMTLRMPRDGDMCYTGPGVVSEFSSGCKIPSHPVLIVRRKVRKYDWSKTLGDVLTISPLIIQREEEDVDGIHLKSEWPIIFADKRQRQVARVWQPNIHGKCPVDPEASIVRVRFMDDHEAVVRARDLGWGSESPFGLRIVAWQFIRLDYGYEW